MKKKIDLSNVTPDTWARTILLFLALINQLLAIFGKGQIEIAESDVYQICTIIFTIISAVAAWWKNNSFSQSAQVGDIVMHSIEGGELEYTGKTNPHTTDHEHKEVG